MPKLTAFGVAAAVDEPPMPAGTGTPKDVDAEPDERIVSSLAFMLPATVALGGTTLVVTLNGLPLPAVTTTSLGSTPSSAATLERYAASSKLVESPATSVVKLTDSSAAASVDDGAPI